MAITETKTDNTSSPVDNMKLPKPAVIPEEIALPFTVSNCTEIAAPPPVITASVQPSIGLTSVSNVLIVSTPATAASGVAIVSNMLSSLMLILICSFCF